MNIKTIIRYHIAYYINGLNYYLRKYVKSYNNGVATVNTGSHTYKVIIHTTKDKGKLLTHNCTCPTKHRICKHVVATYIYSIKDGYKPLTEYEESVLNAYNEIENMTEALRLNHKQTMEKTINTLSIKINWSLISDKRFEKHCLLLSEIERRLYDEHQSN